MVVLQYRCVQLLLKCPICRCGAVDREKDGPFVAGSRYDLPPNRMELIRQQIAHELVTVHHFKRPAGVLIRELPIQIKACQLLGRKV